MQSAKDTFYMALRDRLAALNPARTVVVRGVVRAGSVVEENELARVAPLMDAFYLRWTGLRVDARGALPLVAMGCEVRYGTVGSAVKGGMDRGRMLAGMDAELAAAVNGAPQSVVKRSFVGSAAGAAMGTRVFWGDVVFGAAVADGDRLERVTTVEVFAYQEAGEL